MRKVDDLTNNMNEKAKKNINNINVNKDFDGEYRKICNDYLGLKKEDRPNLETYL
jgi:hypothetical protein